MILFSLIETTGLNSQAKEITLVRCSVSSGDYLARADVNRTSARAWDFVILRPLENPKIKF